jgi:hypothetical protein
MKPLSIGLFLLLSLLTAAGAENTKHPQTFGTIYAECDSTLNELESFRPSLVRQPELRGFSREYLQIPQQSAKARYPVGTRLHWLVRYRLSHPDTFPQAVQQLDLQGFELHPLKVESTSRVLMLSESTPYRATQHSGLSLNVTPVNADTLRLEAAQELAPGEYALVYQPREVGAQVYCFAIEATTKEKQ